MSKKIVKILSSIVTGLGLCASVPAFTSSCGKSEIIAEDLTLSLPSGQINEVKTYTNASGSHLFPFQVTSSTSGADLTVTYHIESTYGKLITINEKTGEISWQKLNEKKFFEFNVYVTLNKNPQIISNKLLLKINSQYVSPKNLTISSSAGTNIEATVGKEGFFDPKWLISTTTPDANTSVDWKLQSSYGNLISIDSKGVISWTKDINYSTYRFTVWAVSKWDQSCESNKITFNIISSYITPKNLNLSTTSSLTISATRGVSGNFSPIFNVSSTTEGANLSVKYGIENNYNGIFSINETTGKISWTNQIATGTTYTLTVFVTSVWDDSVKSNVIRFGMDVSYPKPTGIELNSSDFSFSDYFLEGFYNSNGAYNKSFSCNIIPSTADQTNYTFSLEKHPDSLDFTNDQISISRDGKISWTDKCELTVEKKYKFYVVVSTSDGEQTYTARSPEPFTLDIYIKDAVTLPINQSMYSVPEGQPNTISSIDQNKLNELVEQNPDCDTLVFPSEVYGNQITTFAIPIRDITWPENIKTIVFPKSISSAVPYTIFGATCENIEKVIFQNPSINFSEAQSFYNCFHNLKTIEYVGLTNTSDLRVNEYTFDVVGVNNTNPKGVIISSGTNVVTSQALYQYLIEHTALDANHWTYMLGK